MYQQSNLSGTATHKRRERRIKLYCNEKNMKIMNELLMENKIILHRHQKYRQNYSIYYLSFDTESLNTIYCIIVAILSILLL